MSNDPQSDERGQPNEKYDKEILLSMYNQYRQEIRAHGKRKSRRYLGSLTVLGVIIGYVYTTNGDARILVLAPFVLGFLYLSHISSMHYVTQLAALLSLIEAELDTPGAEYEFCHGGFSIAHNPRFDVNNFEDTAEFENYDPDANPQQFQKNVQRNVRRGMRLIAFLAYFGIGAYGILSLAFTETPNIQEGFSSTGSIYVATIIFAFQIVLFWYIYWAWSAYRDHEDILREGVQRAKEDGIEPVIGKIDFSNLND